MLGDNEWVINSEAIPHSKMHKCWVASLYHRVRHTVAPGIINIHHVIRKKNPANILSKHWDLPSVWNTMKPLLFWNCNYMKQGGVESKEKGNKEDADVAKLVSKLDAKYNVKVTVQGEGQKEQSQLYQGE